MELRLELMPPALDESLVARLADLAEEIDCGHSDQTAAQVAAFNELAKTRFEFIDFQGIYGGQDHDTWVRQVLAEPYERRLENVTELELVELARRVMEADGPEHAIGFWLGMLKVNIPNARISDLIFWPDKYFGHSNYSDTLTPEQVIDIAMRDGQGIP